MHSIIRSQLPHTKITLATKTSSSVAYYIFGNCLPPVEITTDAATKSENICSNNTWTNFAIERKQTIMNTVQPYIRQKWMARNSYK